MRKRYNDYMEKLEKKGYKCTQYSDNAKGEGVAYYETKSSVLKITYEWLKVSDNHFKAGYIINIDNVTECYR